MFEESLTCPSQDSTASSSVVMFESAMADTPQPRKPMTPLRTAEQLDTDEPLDRSQFAVYEDNLPEWQMISESYTTHRKDLHTRIIERLKELQDLEAWYETKNGEFHAKVEEAYLRQSDELVQQKSVLDMDKQKHERDRELVLEVKRLQSEKIKLNVGGQIFVTSITTLTKDPDSLLARMFGPNGTAVPEADGSYFIDRDGTYFRYVLNYLRDLTIPESVRQDHKIMDELIQEAQYYQIKGLLKLKWTNLPLITQHELHEMYPRPTMVAPSDEMVHAHHAAVVFHLEGKDLSGLDFSYYHIDPRSSFAGSNLENARFDKAWFMFDFEQKVNFSDTYLVGATFPRVDDLNRVQTSPDVQFNFEGAIKDDHEY